MRPAAAVLILEDEIGLGKPRVDVAQAEARAEEGVGRPIWRTAKPLIACHAGVNEPRVLAHRLQGVEHRRHLLILHDDQLDGPLRCLLVVGSHNCNLVARKADNVLR